jgi:hypothetical protein
MHFSPKKSLNVKEVTKEGEQEREIEREKERTKLLKYQFHLIILALYVSVLRV